MTTTQKLSPDRYLRIVSEVTDYLGASGERGEFDADAIVDAVAVRANSVDDLTEDEFNAILMAHAL